MNAAILEILKKEASLDTPFGREFRAAIRAQDSQRVRELALELADEVERIANNKR